MFSISALRASADSPPYLLQSVPSGVLFEVFNLFRVRFEVWEVSSAGGSFWTCVRGVLAAPVLEVAQSSSIYTSAVHALVCMASLFASTDRGGVGSATYQSEV